MSRSNRSTLSTSISRQLYTRLRAAVDRAGLPSVTVAGVVADALEAYLPSIEALAIYAESERERQERQRVIKRIEQHLKHHPHEEQQHGNQPS